MLPRNRMSNFTVNLNQFIYVVSLDVHAANIYIYVVNLETGEIISDCNLPGNNDAVLKHLNKIHVSPKKTLIIYEAGSAGFSPFRAFTKANYSCRVIAPSSIPQQVKRQKTDRNDTINNFHYCTSNLLRYVTVPMEEDENNRELIRYRYDLVYQATKQKQKVLAFIKRAGLKYDLTKTNWTVKHMNWLKTVTLPRQGRYLLDLVLKELYFLETQIENLDKELDAIIKDNTQYKATTEILQTIAGIGRIGAITLTLEINDFTRFAHPNALMSFTGLVPGKHASGGSDPSLHITKAGNKYLRIAYIGAAKSYRDRRLLRTNSFLKKQPEPIREFLERLQNRLYSRYRYLCSNGKPSNKAKCAIARELCGFTWELLVKVSPVMITNLKKAA